MCCGCHSLTTKALRSRPHTHESSHKVHDEFNSLWPLCKAQRLCVCSGCFVCGTLWLMNPELPDLAVYNLQDFGFQGFCFFFDCCAFCNDIGCKWFVA